MTMLTDKGVAFADIPNDPITAVAHAICWAPSGGNVQPWQVEIDSDGVVKAYRAERTSLMDVAYRGSYVAAGAALYNALTAASYHASEGHFTVLPGGEEPELLFSVQLGQDGPGTTLSSEYLGMLRRMTNRRVGSVRPFDPGVVQTLQTIADNNGVNLRLMSDRDEVAVMADILAESDRIRYMTPLLAEQMLGELVDDSLGMGIGLGTLDLSATDRMKLRVIREPGTLAALRSIQYAEGRTDFGTALGESTRKRVNASSGVLVLTGTSGASPEDYMFGGMALEELWVRLCQLGFGVQPVSPVFLYARSHAELKHQSAEYHSELAELQRQFNRLVGIRDMDTPILVLRVSHDVGRTTRSLRLPYSRIIKDNRVK